MIAKLSLSICTALTALSAAADCPAALDVPSAAQDTMQRVLDAPDQATANWLTLEMFKEYWTVAPDEKAQMLLDKGMKHRESYEYDYAAATLDELVAYCPDYAEGHNQRAFVAFLRGNFDKAIPHLERAIEINPEHFAAMSGLATTLLHAGRNEAGQGMLREALKLNPWLPERAYLVERPGEDT